MSKNTLFSLVIIFFAATVLVACTPLGSAPTNNSNPTETTTEADSELTEKSGFTTLSGTISDQGAGFILRTGSETIVVQSLSYDLNEYVGQSVTVTGKYSGDELFISELTAN